jgi:prepilin-type N-terminal cleavage/methylation domain-containing protein
MSTHRNNSRGFSLIELMVALTIFSIVMTVSIGTLIVLIDANGKAQALSSAMTNLSFAIDSMTRNLRTGRNFNCVSSISSTAQDGLINSFGVEEQQDCLGGQSAIVFTPGFESSWRMAYRLNGDVIEQWIDKPSQTDSWVAITSDAPPAAVDISTLKFIVQGSDDYLSDGDDDQPRIVLLIAGTVENGLEEATEFQVQSNVIQRVLNY